MSIDWSDIAQYLSVPGTDDNLVYHDGFLEAEDDESRFPVHDHIADFLGDSDEGLASGAQSEYWESTKPGIRPPRHPVQVQFAEQRFEYLEQFISFDEIDSAVDIGCGNGVAAVSLDRRVDVTFGLDMSEHLLEQMPSDIVGLRADSSALPLNDNAVDLSMCWEMIHHVPDPMPVFQEMARVTRKQVVLFEPNRLNPLQAGFSMVVPEERLTLRNSRRFLVNAMKRAGLEVVHCATVGCLFPNKSPVWLAKILRHMPFRIPLLGISHLVIAEVP